MDLWGKTRGAARRSFIVGLLCYRAFVPLSQARGLRSSDATGRIAPFNSIHTRPPNASVTSPARGEKAKFSFCKLAAPARGNLRGRTQSPGDRDKNANTLIGGESRTRVSTLDVFYRGYVNFITF